MTFGPKEYFVPGRIYEFGGFNHDYSFYRRLGREPRETLLVEGSEKKHSPRVGKKYLLIGVNSWEVNGKNIRESFTRHAIKFLSPDGIVVVDHFNRFNRRLVERWEGVGVLEDEEFINEMVVNDSISLLPGKLYRWRLDDTDDYGSKMWTKSLEKENAKGQMARYWPEYQDVFLCTKIEWIREDDERSYHKGYYWKFSFLNPEGQVVVDEIHQLEHAFFRWELV